MSRKSQAKPAPADAAKPVTPAVATSSATPDPAAALQVVPEPTGAASAPASAAAEAAAAPVDPKPAAKAAETAPAKPAAPAVVTVKGPAKGRWRIGRHFTPDPVEIPLADLSEDEIARLKADPELTCAWPG